MGLFDRHSRDSRELAVADGSSVSLKFASILQLENYIQVAHLEYQDRERQIFSLEFLEIKVNKNTYATISINRFMQRIQGNLGRVANTYAGYIVLLSPLSRYRLQY